MRLNYDILFVIQGFLQDLPNTGRLMRTCWTLYDAGVPRLLRLLKGRVSISKYYNLVSFCVFMLRRRHNRFQYLVELDISLDRDIHPVNQDPRIINVITRMFKNASQLAKLRLSHPYSPIATEDISSAIATLSSLRTITINDMCAEALPILNKMKSPIRKAKISFDPDWAEDGGDPVPLLQSLSDSLQYLDVSWVSFEALDVEYPHVVTLEAEFCCSVDFESLYSAFPNLRFLFLHFVQDDEWEMWADEHRGRNILAQADLGTWQSLARIDTSVIALYFLAFQCKVEHVCLYSYMLKMEHRHPLRTVLTDTRPTAVSLSLSANEFDISLLGDILAQAAGTLHELRLGIDSSGEQFSDPSPSLKNMLATFSQLPIRLLHMSMDWSYDPASPAFDFRCLEDEDSIFMKPHVHVRPECPLDTIDVEELAKDAMRAIPSLRYICLSTNRYRSGQVWEVRPDAEGRRGERRLLRLTAGDGQRILDESLLRRVAPEIEL